MGFRNGAWGKIWNHEDKGKYSVVELSTSRKDRETGDYRTDFSSKFVRFIGTAHDRLNDLQENGRIKIGECEVTTEKGNDGKWYTNFLVYSFDNADDVEASTPTTARATKGKGREPDEIQDDADSDLPY